jgi:hypothetical protein
MRLRYSLVLVLLAALAGAASAQAAVTTSSVSNPADGAVIRFTGPNDTRTIAVSGQTNGGAGDAVDLVCTNGSGASFHADFITKNVPVQADGSFSFNGQDTNAQVERCVIRALPASGTLPTATTDLSGFTGPSVYLGSIHSITVDTGPNAGLLYDYFVTNSQSAGGMGFLSIGSCGLDESFVFNPTTLARSNALFNCNAYFWNRDSDKDHATRSEAQVDGANAYVPTSAYYLFDTARNNPGLPALTYDAAFTPGSADLTITESEPFAVCPGNPFPATADNCQRFSSAGVDVTRTITMDHLGRQARITDVYTSHDGAAHTLDLLYEQDMFSDKVAYRFPWRDSTYKQYALGDVFPGPGGSSPGSIYVKGNIDAPDGDETDPQGAISYSSPPNEIRVLSFSGVATPDKFWAMRYQRTVPASGSLTLAFVYSNAFLAADVNGMAGAAEASFPKSGGGGGGNTNPAIAFSGMVLRAHRFTVSRGRFAVDLACPANTVGSCKGTATLSGPASRKADAARSKKKRTVVYGKASFSIKAGAHKAVTIKLTSAGRKALSRRHGKLTATLKVAARDGAGHSKTTSSRSTLVAGRKK